jgi:hypothetical protein
MQRQRMPGDDAAALSVRAANDAMLDRPLTDRSNVEALAALDGVLADEWRVPLVERLDQYGSLL